MKSSFPFVAVIGDENLAQGLVAPAFALGVKLEINPADLSKRCDVLTLVGGHVPISKIRNWEAKGLTVRPASSVITSNFAGEDGEYFVLVARSPHNQGSVWAPMEKLSIGNSMSIASAVALSERQVAQAQSMALEKARDIELVGVACVGFYISKSGIEISSLGVGPTRLGDWSVLAARTSQYEQHLRAILDLPLGDTRLNARYVVSGFFQGQTGANMYRPYLHLMARSPGLKFQQHLSNKGTQDGQVTALGNNLLELRESVAHALDYLNGDIDE